MTRSSAHLRSHLTYANIMSTIAVVATLSTGTAYAAARIGSPDVIDNSLRSADVRNGTLTGADIGVDKVGSADVAGLNGADVADGSLTGADLGDDSLTGADMAALVGADLADGSLDGSELGSGSVTSGHVADGSLTADDLGTGAVGADEVADGSVGFLDISASARDLLLPLAYVANGGGDVTDADAGDGRQVMFSKTLPAGHYVVTFAGQAANPAITDRGFNCIIDIGGSNAGTVAGETLRSNDGVEDHWEQFAIVGSGTLPAGGDIALACIAPTGVVNVHGYLVATRVRQVQ